MGMPMVRVRYRTGVAAGVALTLAWLPISAGHASTSGQRSATAMPFVTVAQAADVCAVIDDATAAAALGGAVERNGGPGIAGMCSWRATQTPGDALTVQVDAGGQEKFDFDHGSLPVHDLSGVGDAAFAFASPAGFVQLGMMKGGTYVTILLQRQATGGLVERAAVLAQTIASRM